MAIICIRDVVVISRMADRDRAANISYISFMKIITQTLRRVLQNAAHRVG
jgi:hypothetical protein